MRRPQPLHPSPLLIDQHGRILRSTARRIASTRFSHLIRVAVDIPLEEYESPRLYRLQEKRFSARDSSTPARRR